MEKEKERKGTVRKVKRFLKREKVPFVNLTLLKNEDYCGVCFVVYDNDDENFSHWLICLPMEELEKRMKEKTDFENYITEQILDKVWEDKTVPEKSEENIDSGDIPQLNNWDEFTEWANENCPPPDFTFEKTITVAKEEAERQFPLLSETIFLPTQPEYN